VRTPKGLILDLLSAAPGGELEVAGLLRASRLFGISDNNLRVALTRLRRAGLVEVGARGRYRIGTAADVLHRQVAGWRTAEARVRRWDGAWIGVVEGTVPGAAARRRRDRALGLLGLRPLAARVQVRPDNLVGGAARAREHLTKLGLEPDAVVVRMDELDSDARSRLTTAWDCAALDQGYRRGRAKLQQRRRRIDRLGLQSAAREAFLAGGEAIRRIVFDPLLPEEMIDRPARRAFVDEAIAFDRRGQAIWAELLGLSDAPIDLAGVDRRAAATSLATGSP
jgi:phenylacetic acid degradation operon negative regulatory protein